MMNIEMEVKYGLDFIIRHFVDQGQALWSPSRGILAGVPASYSLVHSIEEAFEIFKSAEFKDCRINGYARPSRHRIRYPSLLLFDVDEAENLPIILERIKRYLGGHPTVLETSPGHFHILQPVSAELLADLFLNDLDKFLGFVNSYIGDGVLTCPGHHPTLKPCMLRLPGSINTRSDFQVRIVQEWDERLGSIKALELPFAETLARATVRPTTRRRRGCGVGRGYKRIDDLLQQAVKHGREIIIWKILAPYLINVHKLSEDEAFDIITGWMDKCNVLRSTHITKDVIKSHLRNARTFRGKGESQSLLPISLSKLKKEYEIVYQQLGLMGG